MVGSAEPFQYGRRPLLSVVRWAYSTERIPGVLEDDMPRRNSERKPGTTRGSPRRSRTAKATRINRYAVKSCCACEWDGWGRLSEDGAGQNNPNPSEDPWGRATMVAQTAVCDRIQLPDSELTELWIVRHTKGEGKPRNGTSMPRVGLIRTSFEKVSSEMLALKPYWGKPAVRNFREDDGDVGIIRSPVRAIVLPGSLRAGARWPRSQATPTM